MAFELQFLISMIFNYSSAIALIEKYEFASILNKYDI